MAAYLTPVWSAESRPLASLSVSEKNVKKTLDDRIDLNIKTLKKIQMGTKMNLTSR